MMNPHTLPALEYARILITAAVGSKRNVGNR
jgi:hypothetical protein